MNPFFDTPEKISRLQSHAGLWLGTPFVPNAALCGAGVCCQKLVGALYRELGVVPADFEVPSGPMDWSHANKRSLIAEFMERQPNFFSVSDFHVSGFDPGDMVGFKIGGCLHHCGIVVAADGKFIHCLRGPGTIFSSLRDATYFSRLEKIWRPLLIPHSSLPTPHL